MAGLRAVAGIFIAIFSAAAQAGETAVEDEGCFLCHGDPDASKTTVNGEVVSLYVDADAFAESLHGPLGCTACHAAIKEVPHPEEVPPVDCGVCHAEAEEYATSLHGKALARGDGDVHGCYDCHGKHDIRRAADPLSSTHPRNQPGTCGKCHSDPALVRRHMVSVVKPSEAYLKSVHGRAVVEKGNLDAAVCNHCHGTHSILPAHDPNSPVFRMNIPNTCGACHGPIVTEYMQSIHGRALSAGIRDAPTCIDCHGEHHIEPPESAASPVHRRNVSRVTCPRCHDDERVMKRYGLETMRQASYLDSYHGLASAAGSLIVANCTSCHGTHNILPAADPDSSIHPNNLPTTCGQCHKGAGENFASGAVHIIPTHPDQKAYGIVRLIYICAIILIIGGMVGHNTLLMARHAFVKFREELKGPGTYRRFNLGQTIGHLVLTVAFIVLVVSGFALRYPESWWSRLLFFGDTGLEVRALIHRVGAVLLIVVTAINGIYILFTRSGRKELWALTVKPKDVRDAIRNLGFALGLAKKPPRFDRYSYSEKFEYWGMWWGSVIMIFTGLCMWFANTFLRFFPKIALDIAALIHFYEAWLALGTIVIWHFYYMIFDPDTYPMNWSWITGRITEADFKVRHPLEYEKVAKKAANPEACPDITGGTQEDRE